MVYKVVVFYVVVYNGVVFLFVDVFFGDFGVNLVRVFLYVWINFVKFDVGFGVVFDCVYEGLVEVVIVEEDVGVVVLLVEVVFD